MAAVAVHDLTNTSVVSVNSQPPLFRPQQQVWQVKLKSSWSDIFWQYALLVYTGDRYALLILACVTPCVYFLLLPVEQHQLAGEMV